MKSGRHCGTRRSMLELRAVVLRQFTVLKYLNVPTVFASCLFCVPANLPRPPESCLKPLVRGQCQALGQSWYFDYTKNDCFQYARGLCGAGPNIFLAKQSCLAACKQPPGKRLPKCLTKARTGGCHTKKFAWFFDSDVGQCKMFEQGDCGTGGNYFASELKCKQECLRKYKFYLQFNFKRTIMSEMLPLE
ncbi:hypothetical protein HPB50_003894 [Hyalomma asiaticum]|uniref:Uncharacterized protein n=1 Tax=Hyalomma asiaticum TaxID=266040 RepID=A0ACB7RVD9_HYAAI|nr:hypothetical protein HPB50_003894 [Hyalomma asiaticum]